MKKISNVLFSILMILSILILAPFILNQNKAVQAADAPACEDSKETSDEESLPERTPASEDDIIPAEETLSQKDSTDGSANSGETEFEDVHDTNAETNHDTGELPSKDDYFSDALFIGDSRTMGLMEYAQLETPDFFASSGMSVFQVLKKEISVPTIGKTTLKNLLQNKSYGKIFLMLGINELGYEYNSIIKQYTKVVDFIREQQPDAQLILCANLHITQKRSSSDEIYNNANINRLNEAIAAFADNQSIFTIDVNPLFDDENGALNEDYSADDTHPYGKYYFQWGDWLYETCVNLR